MIPYEWLEQAQARIASHICRTPLTHDEQRGLYIKWENHQVTGSFKPRGALNKVLSLEGWERQRGLVAASAGNHGQGLALAGQLTQAAVEVFVSDHAVPAKVQAMQDLGARIHIVPGGYSKAEAAGRAYAGEQQKTFVSPYNDGQVIAGQGTVGLEIMDELREQTSVWLGPSGGGGLISAIGTLLAKQKAPPKLIGLQAVASPFTYRLFHTGTQAGAEDLPTLADGLSGAVEEGSVTIPMMQKFLDDLIVVTEEEIARAIACAWYVFHEKIEGSGAVGLAAILTGKIKLRPALVIVTGGNIQPEIHAEIVNRYAREKWD